MTVVEKTQSELAARLPLMASKEDVRDLKNSIEKVQQLPAKGLSWGIEKLFVPVMTALLVAGVLSYMHVAR